MGYSKYNFRDYYHHFVAIPLDDQLKEAIKDFPGAKVANYLLAYGFIDPDTGFTFEVLASCKRSEASGLLVAKEPNNEIRVMLQARGLVYKEIFFFNESRVKYREKYKEKIEALHYCDVNNEVEETRKMTFLDDSRDDYFIDNVLVYLRKDGLNQEACWVRITGLLEGCFVGELLNEPNQDFGVHINEKIHFYVDKTEDNKTFCFSDMNSLVELNEEESEELPEEDLVELTEEDLADGSLLEEAIRKFNSDRNEDNLFDVFQLLRDSYVYIPCNAVLDEKDQQRLDAMFQGKTDEELKESIGKEIHLNENVRLVPDILQKGEECYIPVFTTSDNMSYYERPMSSMQEHFLDIMMFAENNEKDIQGIVVNAFTDPFVVGKELFPFIKDLQSLIEINNKES